MPEYNIKNLLSANSANCVNLNDIAFIRSGIQKRLFLQVYDLNFMGRALEQFPDIFEL